jgi:hypothetical protein
MPAGEFIYKILLVGDGSDFVSATETVLESRYDFRVLTAIDGVFALSTAGRWQRMEQGNPYEASLGKQDSIDSVRICH